MTDAQQALAAARERHTGLHSCFGLDPIMGAGYRNFGTSDGVVCDVIRVLDAVVVLDHVNAERLAKILPGIFNFRSFIVPRQRGDPSWRVLAAEVFTALAAQPEETP